MPACSDRGVVVRFSGMRWETASVAVAAFGAEKVGRLMRAGKWYPCKHGGGMVILREIPGCKGAFRKLCTIPFLRDGKLSLSSLMQYRGCGAKDNDYAQAKKMLGRKRRVA